MEQRTRSADARALAASSARGSIDPRASHRSTPMNQPANRRWPAAEAESARCPLPWAVNESMRERFRRIRMSLPGRDDAPRCLGVCSSNAGEGVSWITSKLACAFAESGEATIIVDAHRSDPAQLELFDLASAQRAASPSLHSAGLSMRRTSWPQLSIVSRDTALRDEGSIAEQRAELTALPDAIESLRAEARWVLVD